MKTDEKKEISRRVLDFLRDECKVETADMTKVLSSAYSFASLLKKKDPAAEIPSAKQKLKLKEETKVVPEESAAAETETVEEEQDDEDEDEDEAE